MKILQVNCVYKKGSTGKIVYDIHSELRSRGYESVVCYGRGQKIKEPNVYKTCGELYSKVNNVLTRFHGNMHAGCTISTLRLIHIMKKEKPDIVHLHCINGYFVNIYWLIAWLKKNNIPTVLTLHAEFMYTGGCGYSIDCNQWRYQTGCGYSECPRWHAETGSLFFDRTSTIWKKLKNAFDGFDKKLIVASVSPWLQKRAQESVILKGKKHVCVLNGIDTENVFHYIKDNDLREKLNLVGKKVVLYVTGLFTEFKGSKYIMKLANCMPDIQLVVVGNKNEISDCPANILPIGRVENQVELAKFYSMADVTVLVSKQETFSMVCAESLACGTPIAGFKAGAPETISIPEYSKFCEYGEVESLISNIRTYLDASEKGKIDKAMISNIAAQHYAKQKMCDEYIRIYEGILDE